MSGLSKWATLYELYRESHRASIIRGLYRRPIDKSRPYWIAFAIYMAVSLLAFATVILTPSFVLPMLAIVATACAIYVWLEFMVAKEFEGYFKKHSLKQQPFFSRTKYLSYLLFVEKLGATQLFVKNDVGALVEWENIRQEKVNTLDYFQSPVVLMILGASLTSMGTFLAPTISSNFKYLFAVFYLIFAALWFGWFVSDWLKSHKKKTLEICRFLKWWELES